MTKRILMPLILLMIAMVLLSSPFAGAAEKDALKQYVSELKVNPDNLEVREKIIKYAQSQKQKPSVPEEFERLMSRGAAFLKMANDAAGYTKAVDAFKEAVALAPWAAEGYEGLAEALEKAGSYAEAIQNLNFALLADPNGKNSRDLRNKVYELEVFAEEANQKLKASPTIPPPAPPTVAKPAPPERKKPAAAPEKKTNPKAFVGSWFYKDTAPRGGEFITTQAFSVTMNASGELAAQAPRRSTGAVGKVTIFELSDDNIHIQVTWKLATIPSYWKTEDYDVTLSNDETKLAGSYKIKSSGSREFAEDKVLFKQ
ncbi:MAG: hypothetical protein OEW15_09165 [Nitrospirota bacterium]|nr:hypothetical protein [Nitrospirota bacterium]